MCACFQTDKKLRRSVSDSGEEIEVVHQKRHPKLHGILKQQRTVSESSDDAGVVSRQTSQASTGNESTSPTLSEGDGYWGEAGSGEDGGGRKKSVSFSERIDQTTFNRNQSVSSMREVLRNKRKRQKAQQRRKQQEQQVRAQGRRRRNSNSISEVSSDEALVANGKDDSSDVTSPETAKPDVEKEAAVVDASANGDDVKDKSEPSGAALNGHEVRMASDDDSDDVEDRCDEDDQSDAVVPSQAEEKPETMLSWNEQPLPDDMKPKCAVALDNNVMFDLDID